MELQAHLHHIAHRQALLLSLLPKQSIARGLYEGLPLLSMAEFSLPCWIFSLLFSHMFKHQKTWS